jgi:predicted nucleic acid-binding protein
MKNTLIDAGPMIALFNSDDKYHPKIMGFLKTYKGILTTTWSVVTEVCYMLRYNTNVQIDFLRWIDKGGIKIEDIGELDIRRIIELSQKYSDIPMDLADASLIIIAERLKVKDIITIDSDYYIYRNINKEMLTNIFDYKA